MRPLPRLHSDSDFPPSCEALEDPNGLLAIGGDLSAQRLILAYRRGIFPWYEAPQPLLWWTPDPRSVLFPAELHVSNSLRKILRRNGFQLAVDQQFTQVMCACAAARGDTIASCPSGPGRRPCDAPNPARARQSGGRRRRTAPIEDTRGSLRT